MRRVKVVILMLLLVLCVPAPPAFAGRVQFKSLSFSLGSLLAAGELAGLGNQDVVVVLEATGEPEVTCTNQGGTKAPGQNPPKVAARGAQFLVRQKYTKNGTSPFSVETSDPQTGLSAKALACPNNNWIAKITFVYWTDAVLTVRAGSESGTVLLQQSFSCSTTKESVRCTPKR
jgi:hypothetical protein